MVTKVAISKNNECAADACFTSHNSMTWKQAQMADVKGRVAFYGAPRTQVPKWSIQSIASKVKLNRSMEQELAELEDRQQS